MLLCMGDSGTVVAEWVLVGLFFNIFILVVSYITHKCQITSVYLSHASAQISDSLFFLFRGIRGEKQ